MKIKAITAGLLLLGIMPISACVIKDDKGKTENDQLAEYRKITAEEVLRILEGTGEYILFDVRTEEEFKQAHIEGAILIPDYEIP